MAGGARRNTALGLSSAWPGLRQGSAAGRLQSFQRTGNKGLGFIGFRV